MVVWPLLIIQQFSLILRALGRNNWKWIHTLVFKDESDVLGTKDRSELQKNLTSIWSDLSPSSTFTYDFYWSAHKYGSSCGFIKFFISTVDKGDEFLWWTIISSANYCAKKHRYSFPLPLPMSFLPLSFPWSFSVPQGRWSLSIGLTSQRDS